MKMIRCDTRSIGLLFLSEEPRRAMELHYHTITELAALINDTRAVLLGKLNLTEGAMR